MNLTNDLCYNIIVAIPLSPSVMMENLNVFCLVKQLQKDKFFFLSFSLNSLGFEHYYRTVRVSSSGRKALSEELQAIK